MIADYGRKRARAALTTLSAVGARLADSRSLTTVILTPARRFLACVFALAGAGVGALLGAELRPLAWWIVAIGILAHLVGMVGVRKLLAAIGYDPPAWQVGAYWLCWAAIAAIVGYGLIEVVR